MTASPWWRVVREPGWRVVGIGAMAQFLHFGLFQQAYSVYVPVLVDTMGWSVASLGLVFALHQAVAGAMGPLQGRALARWGSRRLAVVGTTILGIALVGLATSSGFVAFAVWFVVGAFGQYLAGFLTMTTSVVSWFGRTAALPLSLMQTGLSLAGLIAPIVAWAIGAFGWRAVLAMSAAIITVVGLALARGLQPGPYAPSRTAALDGTVDRAYRGAVRSRSFWTIAAGHALALAVVHGVNVYVVLYLTTRGVSLSTGASMVALSTVAMLAGQLSGGLLGSRYPSRWLTSGCMLVHAGALTLLVTGPIALVMAPFAVMHGFAWGVRGPIMQSMRVEYFGTDAFARVMGLSLMIATVGAVIGPLAVGIAADHAFGFDGAMIALAATAIIGAVAFGASTTPTALD